MLYEREQILTLLHRLDEEPERLIVIAGPRQTGKTTLVLQALERGYRPHRYVPVDEPASAALMSFPGDDRTPFEVPEDTAFSITGERDARWLVRQWERARLHADRSERGFVLAFDEIQKIPNWPESVKGLWDADRRQGRRLHVVLLGSAPLLMQQGMSESLAGRYEMIRLAHWSFAEMSAAFGFDLSHYVYFGGYPGAAALAREQDRWQAYVADAIVEPNIERDILAMQRVHKPALLKRVFELGARYSGQILAYNKMLGPLRDAGNTTTLTRYLNLLSDAGLLTGLSKHTGSPVSARASTPKLNVLNTALMAVASGYTFEEARADRSYWGRTVESAVGAHLINTASPRTTVKYWRDGRYEVDFVLQRGPSTVGIEVKSGTVPAVLPGLSEFEHRLRPRRTVVAGESHVPLHEFLSLPADHWIDSP